MSSLWDARAEAYRRSPTHREGEDLDLLVRWAEPGPGVRALDVATGGGHVARRLAEAGCEVTSCDPSPAMRPTVICRAEDLPFADESFDVVVTRIAPHHFEDVAAAVAEMARVSRKLVLIEDTLYASEQVEEAERLRDPSHVRNYSESEWRAFLAGAGLEVEEVAFVEKRQDLEDWLARAGCRGEEAERVRGLLAHGTEDGFWTDTKILLKARKREMATPFLTSRTRRSAATRRLATSSGAPVASGYERSLRPCEARVSRPAGTIWSEGDR